MSERIRVLVVDDSALMRKLIPRILAGDPNIEVIGTAMDGAFALKKIADLKPDVVTLDLEMPRMDGLETLRMLTRRFHLPVIVCSTHSKQGAYCTFKALALGAIDFVAKPHDAAAGHIEAIAGELIEKIKVAWRVGAHKQELPVLPEPQPVRKTGVRATLPPNRVVAIGISTGGPNALQYVLSQLPPDFPACILVVQHMPEGFTDMFARRLDECCAVDVQEARSGDLLLAGRVLVCPGNRHLMVRRMPRGDVAILSDAPPVNGHRPSADVLFHSVAQEYGAAAVGVIMTGMGDDGADGLGAIKAAGGHTAAQSEDSCVVSSMPRAAILKGFASKIVALDKLGGHLISQCGGGRSSPVAGETIDKSNRTEKQESTPVSSPRIGRVAPG